MKTRPEQKFLIPEIDSLPGEAMILDQDARHMAKVLRLTPGSNINVCDGNGNDYLAEIVTITPQKVTIKVTQKFKSLTEPILDITLCCGMLKDKKMDFIIKHCTALGITRWIPFFSERSVPIPQQKRVEKRLQRWQTISNETLKQCRRSRIVNISSPILFEQTLIETANSDLKIAFWEKTDKPLALLKKTDHIKSITLLIGPEGGFSKSEIQAAEKKGFSAWSLGPRILRAETAAISSCAIVQHLLGDM